MNKRINLSVSACLLSGLLISGCSQQQVQAVGSDYSATTSTGGVVLDGYGKPIHNGTGGFVKSASSSSGAGQQYLGSQQVADQQVMDQQVMDHQMQKAVEPKPVIIAKPVPTYKPMVKPAQVHKVRPMTRPVQSVKVRPISHSGSTAHSNSGRPRAAQQCRAKVRVPAQFKNVVKRVQVSPAVNKRVKVRDAQYRYVNKRVQARPASHRYQNIPAQYRTVSKRVLVKPAHYAWQKGKKGPITRIDNMTGEIMCKVKVPAVYKTVQQKVLVRPMQRIKKTIPAVYHNVKQKQFVAPAQYKNIHQPARFVNKSYRIQTRGVTYKWQALPGC